MSDQISDIEIEQARGTIVRLVPPVVAEAFDRVVDRLRRSEKASEVFEDVRTALFGLMDRSHDHYTVTHPIGTQGVLTVLPGGEVISIGRNEGRGHPWIVYIQGQAAPSWFAARANDPLPDELTGYTKLSDAFDEAVRVGARLTVDHQIAEAAKHAKGLSLTAQRGPLIRLSDGNEYESFEDDCPTCGEPQIFAGDGIVCVNGHNFGPDGGHEGADADAPADADAKAREVVKRVRLADGKWYPATGGLCPECGEFQAVTPSGVSCVNGHGHGSDGGPYLAEGMKGGAE